MFRPTDCPPVRQKSVHGGAVVARMLCWWSGFDIRYRQAASLRSECQIPSSTRIYVRLVVFRLQHSQRCQPKRDHSANVQTREGDVMDQRIDQRIIQLYDGFTHGAMNRRDFLERLSEIVGSAATAAALLPILQNDYAKAATIAPDDARLVAGKVAYDAPDGKISGYLVRLKDKARRPAVIVVHENRGLNPHIEDIARRLAIAGYLALAVDLLSPDGGTPSDEDKARDLIGQLDAGATEKRLAAAVPFLEKHPDSTGKVGAVGFCWGGGMINRLAVVSPDLK